MKGINYFAGLGTVLFFIGFYCFKAALHKNTSTHVSGLKYSTKVFLVFAGIISVTLGVYLFVKAVSHK